MAYGLRVWNASGQLTLDISDSLTRLLGSVTVSGTGVLNVPGFSTGRPFYYVVDSVFGAQADYPPIPSISGNNLSWTSQGSPSRPITIVYGVY